MSDPDDAAEVLKALTAAEHEPVQAALAILNGLVGLVQGDPGQPLEVEDARADAFLAICEIGKALHRGQPAEHLWAPAREAAQRWMMLMR
jgi:hypothetical protein